MDLAIIVELHTSGNACLYLAETAIIVRTDFFVFDTAPEPLRKPVAHTTSTDPHPFSASLIVGSVFTLEGSRQTGKRCLFPFGHHIWMHAVIGGNLGNGLGFSHRFEGDLRFKIGSVGLS